MSASIYIGALLLWWDYITNQKHVFLPPFPFPSPSLLSTLNAHAAFLNDIGPYPIIPIRFENGSLNATECTAIMLISDDALEGDHSFNVIVSSVTPRGIMVVLNTTSVVIIDDDG